MTEHDWWPGIPAWGKVDLFIQGKDLRSAWNLSGEKEGPTTTTVDSTTTSRVRTRAA